MGWLRRPINVVVQDQERTTCFINRKCPAAELAEQLLDLTPANLGQDLVATVLTDNDHQIGHPYSSSNIKRRVVLAFRHNRPKPFRLSKNAVLMGSHSAFPVRSRVKTRKLE